ncbi:hypothetical protein D3C72_2415840 [compost metagenome]
MLELELMEQRARIVVVDDQERLARGQIGEGAKNQPVPTGRGQLAQVDAKR